MDNYPTSLKTANRIIRESILDEDYKKIESGINLLEREIKIATDMAIDLYLDVKAMEVKYRVLNMQIK